jgi:hypothetical protein
LLAVIFSTFTFGTNVKATETYGSLTKNIEVYVNEAEIVDKGEDFLELEFTVVNAHEERVNDLMFGIAIKKKEEARTDLYISEKVYEGETFYLNKARSEGSTKEFKVHFDLPENLQKNNYIVRLNIYDNRSERLSWKDVEVELGSLNVEERVYVNNKKPLLLIVDDKVYSLQAGAHINPKDEIEFSLGLQLVGGEEFLNVYPVVESYLRNTGNEDPIYSYSSKDDKRKPLNIKKDNDSNFHFTVPIEIDKGGSYESLMWFVTEDGKKVSQDIKFRLVIEGKSGYISEAFTKKDQYKAGEQAVVSFSFFSSADAANPDEIVIADEEPQGTIMEDVRFEISLLNIDGTKCGTKTYEYDRDVLPGLEYLGKVKIDIVKDCKDFRIKLSMFNEENLIDKYEISVETELTESEDKEKQSSFWDSIKSFLDKIRILIFIIIILLIIFVGYFYIYKKNKL